MRLSTPLEGQELNCLLRLCKAAYKASFGKGIRYIYRRDGMAKLRSIVQKVGV